MELGIEGPKEDSLDSSKCEVAKGIEAVYCGRTGVEDPKTIGVSDFEKVEEKVSTRIHDL
jgi:hypothetical protein